MVTASLTAIRAVIEPAQTGVDRNDGVWEQAKAVGTGTPEGLWDRNRPRGRCGGARDRLRLAFRT